MSNIATHNEVITALEWYIDNGVTDILLDEVVDRTAVIETPAIAKTVAIEPKPTFLGKSDAHEESVKLAKSANSLDDLKNIIAEFDGITLKKTATNMVFSDGNIDAKIMIIGDAPAAEDDRAGIPFSGEQGQLLNKMLGCIDLDRNTVYLSNILNWRPPGNRSPTPSEIAVSLPFIEKHIQLIKPQILVFCGGAVGKALLGRSESLSRLRKKWHDYTPQTKDFNSGKPIPTMVTHSISALIKTPSQKKSAWDDLIMLQSLLNQ